VKRIRIEKGKIRNLIAVGGSHVCLVAVAGEVLSRGKGNETQIVTGGVGVPVRQDKR